MKIVIWRWLLPIGAAILVAGFLLAQQPAPPPTDKATALEERVSSLEKKLATLEERVAVLESKVLPKPKSPTPSKADGYVGNARTMKLHRFDCEWAKRMSPGNRVEFKSREEAVKQGYSPCLVCQP